MLDAALIAVVHELLGVELAAPVRPERFQLQVVLVLGEHMNFLEEFQRPVFAPEHIQPHISTMIINNQQTIFVTF